MQVQLNQCSPKDFSPPFFGREAEIACLDEVWRESSAGVAVIVGSGGVGKTRLVMEWLEKMRASGETRRTFIWSFDRVVSESQSAVAANRFITQALHWFGAERRAGERLWEKAERVTSLVRNERCLLALDGLDAFQLTAAPRTGEITNLALRILVRELAMRNPGLCVITSQTPVHDIAAQVGDSVLQMEVSPLFRDEGARLLRSLGCRGSKSELEKVSARNGNHPLSLLASCARSARHALRGKPSRTRMGRFPDEANHLLRRYELWFSRRIEESVLRILGLFDGPADRAALKAVLAEPAIPGLTERRRFQKSKLRHRERVCALSMHDPAWLQAVASLREMRLLRERGEGEGRFYEIPAFAHAYFSQQLRNDLPSAWREGRRRLSRHFNQRDRSSQRR